MRAGGTPAETVAFVADVELDPAVARRSGEADGPPGMLERVVDEVAERLLEPARVRVELDVRRRVHLEHPARGLGAASRSDPRPSSADRRPEAADGGG